MLGIIAESKTIFTLKKEWQVKKCARKIKLLIGRLGSLRPERIQYSRQVASPLAVRHNQRWSLDFISDALTDGRRFRILTVVDGFTRENLTLIADTSLSGQRVTRELDHVIAVLEMPGTIASDNGT